MIYFVIFMISLILKNKKSSEFLGNDERFPLIEEKNLISKIIENYKKKDLLDYLKSNNINILNKVNTINKVNNNNIPKSINLKSGGLLKDWDFEF